MITTSCAPIVEFRRYTLRPGGRERLIELFDREFVEPQESAGMRVIGQFRDPGAADSFVWLRGFADMAARRRALAEFYGGPVWSRHRGAANDTMIDSDDVLLLRPVAGTPGFPLPGPGIGLDGKRMPVGAAASPDSVISVTIQPVAGDLDEFAGWFREVVEPVLAELGAPSLALLRTENAPNDFPALPVRGGENVFARFTRFDDRGAAEAFAARLAASAAWTKAIGPELTRSLSAAPVRFVLSPTARSLLR